MKRTILFSLLVSCIFFSAFAVPGIATPIPDQAGEFVYYKDSSFNRESYVGVLTYDQSTYQIRYYAPTDKENLLVEKDISILLTVNPEVDYWEMTGERILSTILPESEDVDLVNYLHDILYEFSARRGKVDFTYDTSFTHNEDYAQFGGNVCITYNLIVPMFNIESITDGDGNAVMKCVTIGQIKDSTDKSFENFKGFPAEPEYKKTAAKSKKEKSLSVSYGTQKITLDKSWSQAMENSWIKGDDAFLTLTSVPKVSDSDTLSQAYITRMMLESRQGAYIKYEISPWTSIENGFSLYSESYQPDSDKYIATFRLFTKTDTGFDYLTMSAFKQTLKAQEKYFNSILKSYSSN